MITREEAHGNISSVNEFYLHFTFHLNFPIAAAYQH